MKKVGHDCRYKIDIPSMDFYNPCRVLEFKNEASYYEYIFLLTYLHGNIDHEVHDLSDLKYYEREMN